MTAPKMSVLLPSVPVEPGYQWPCLRRKVGDMLIDCDTCRVRDTGCTDCVISLLLRAPDVSRDLDPAEVAAFTALAGAGLAPPLRLVPLHKAATGAPGPRVQARRATA
jgi:hypothetical protein